LHSTLGPDVGFYPLADDPPEGLPELTIAPGEQYHLRVSVRGYEAGLAREQYPTGEPPSEFHLVQMWPA
jgi:hypothetical protein